MTRWLALALIGVAVSGPATAGPREGEVVVFRTSGQPERRLKVLRVSAFPDGESLADVEDLATGDRFTLPGKVLAAAGRTRSQTSPAAGMEENRPGGKPSIPHPGPPPQGGRGPEGSGNLLLPPPGRGEGGGGGRFGVGDTVGTGQPGITASPEPESTIVRVRLREWAPPVVILPVSANLPVDDATTAPEPQQSMPVPQPQPSADALMCAEIKPLVADLHTALRPTVREDAATGLAEGRYASRPEVKATLAYAAMTDPAPSVRAHCIRCLSALGYHHPVYVDYLRACAGSGAGEVQAAAAGALVRLAPRK